MQQAAAAFPPPNKRIIIFTGHYGSGKTETAVSLAFRLAKQGYFYPRLALVDLDIVNPYFRSREQRKELAEAGISLYGSAYNSEITAELPALGANIRTPLEDSECLTIVDAGGNSAGAMILNQFGKYFTSDNTAMLAVINANRPDTRNSAGAVEHIRAIEEITGMQITGLVNNTHMLGETTAATIIKGHALCEQVSSATNLPICCDCYPEPLIQAKELQSLQEKGSYLLPLGLHMRQSWMNKT